MRILLIVLCMFLLPKALATSIFTEEWPPVSFAKPSGEADGMAVEVVREMQKRLGRKEPIRVVPWARAYQALLNTPNTMLFTVGRNAEREKRMTLLGPVAISSTDLFALSSAAPALRQQSQRWQKLQVAAYRGSIFESTAREAGYQVYPTDSPGHSAKMLLAGRVQLWCEGNIVMSSVLKQLDIPPDRIEKVATLSSLSLYLAFSPGTPPGQISLWEDALRDMKRDGSFQAIYRRWLPNQPIPEQVEVIGIAAGKTGKLAE